MNNIYNTTFNYTTEPPPPLTLSGLCPRTCIYVYDTFNDGYYNTSDCVINYSGMSLKVNNTASDIKVTNINIVKNDPVKMVT